MHLHFRTIVFAATLPIATLAVGGPLRAQEVKLPSTLTFTAYDTGSSGFGIAVAVGKMLKDKYKAEVRVLPAGNDVARLGPLKVGRANMSAMGIGSYFAQEGIFEFAVKDWGPQPLQLIVASTDCNVISLGIAKDAGVKEIKDLKGKRVGFVVGSPALNQNALAILAFGGLTKQDVKIAEFASYGAMWKGIINNEIDAAIASNISGQAKERSRLRAGCSTRRCHTRTRPGGRESQRSRRTIRVTKQRAARRRPRMRRSRARAIPIPSLSFRRTSPTMSSTASRRR